jgi:hypothetical protein
MKKTNQKRLQLGKIQIAALNNDGPSHQKIRDSWTWGSCWPLHCNPVPTTDLEKGKPGGLH